MKMLRVFLAAVLLLSIFLTLLACSTGDKISPERSDASGSEAAGDASGGDAASDVDQWGREIIADSVPPELNFGGGTVNILARSNAFYASEGYFLKEVYAEKDSADVVDSAVYKRNMAVEERLGVKLNVIPMDNVNDQGMHTALIKSVLAGLNEYDLIAGYQYYFPNVATENVLYNLKKAEHLDFDKAWWNRSLMNELTLEGRLYFMSGDISQSMIKGAYSLFFNKRLFDEYIGGDLYALALDGSWTWEKLIAMSDAAYNDLNGDSARDDNDLYAFGSHTGSMIDSLTASCGIRYTERDGDGVPEFALGGERNIKIFETVYKLLFETKGGLALPPTGESSELLIKKFHDASLIFYPTIFYNTERLRDMEDDFGIVPIPRLDENQTGYMGATIDNSSLYAIASNVKNIGMVSATAELMCAEAYKMITPVYYEVALKTKYTRDGVSSQMVDLIRAGVYYDFGALYSTSLNNIGQLPRVIFQSGKTNFTSQIAAAENAFKTKLNELVSAYASLD